MNKKLVIILFLCQTPLFLFSNYYSYRSGPEQYVQGTSFSWYTSLGNAIRFENFEQVKDLVENKNVNINDSCVINTWTSGSQEYPSFTFSLRESYHSSTHKELASQRIFAYLIAHPSANFNKQGTDGNTALHVAAQTSNEQAVIKLLAKNVDITIKNRDGETPYDIVAPYNSTQRDRIKSLLFHTITTNPEHQKLVAYDTYEETHPQHQKAAQTPEKIVTQNKKDDSTFGSGFEKGFLHKKKHKHKKKK